LKTVRALAGLLAITAAGCGQSGAPGAPTGPTPSVSDSTGVTGVVTAMKITAPGPVSPADGSRLETRQPTLVVTNPTASHSPSASLRVRFVVLDPAGAAVHQSAPVALGAGTTRYTLPIELEYDRTFRWSAEVVWNDTSGLSSPAQSFTTPSSPEPRAPVVDMCPGSSPLDIVVCQRAKAPDFMHSGDLVNFLRSVAQNLNSNGVEGGPFGILHKGTGNNCEGYSCDIICAGQGGGQRQWDVLRDTEGPQVPLWSGPHDGDDIRSDVCEIR
jgi:hypothetical protein